MPEIFTKKSQFHRRPTRLMSIVPACVRLSTQIRVRYRFKSGLAPPPLRVRWRLRLKLQVSVAPIFQASLDIVHGGSQDSFWGMSLWGAPKMAGG